MFDASFHELLHYVFAVLRPLVFKLVWVTKFDAEINARVKLGFVLLSVWDPIKVVYTSQWCYIGFYKFGIIESGV